MPPGSSLTALASTLESVAERFGLSSMLLEQRLQRRWADIVGDAVAAHTRPDTIRFKKLYLIAENSVWLQQLTFLKPSLLEKIAAAIGKPAVVDIVLRVGEVGASRGAAPLEGAGESGRMRDHVNASSPGPSAEVMAEAACHTQSIADTELRAHFTEVMARAVTNRAPKPPRRPAP